MRGTHLLWFFGSIIYFGISLFVDGETTAESRVKEFKGQGARACLR
jgi:hypothetical protein